MTTALLLVSLVERLSQVNVIIGIILCALGIAIACLARRIACAARKSGKVPNDDTIMITTKVIGLIFIVIALVVMIIQ
ncbi:MAG: hypothetical protein IJ301_01610 [Clostridia bacterium]|nr:hypothetical protein [Clostridia bacterium]